MAIFSAGSRCSPDNAPRPDGSEPFRVAAKFRILADIPLASAEADTGHSL
jgi:hypothetical protein